MTHIPSIYQIWSQILYSLKCMVNLTQLPNLPKFGPWWRHNDIVAPDIYIFRSSYPFFLTQRSILVKKQYFNFPNRKGYVNTLKANISKKHGNIYWNSNVGLQWRQTPREILLAFEMCWQISKLWQAITSSKINIFWCVFFVRSVVMSRLQFANKKWGYILRGPCL